MMMNKYKLIIFFAMSLFYACKPSDLLLKKDVSSLEAINEFTQFAKEGNLKKIKLYVKSGIDVNTLDEHGFCALSRATYNNRTDTALYLLSVGANPINGGSDWNPFLIASHRGYNDILVKLLQYDIDVNERSKRYGYTSLYLSSMNGNYETSLILLMNGADPNIATDEKITPLMTVSKNGDILMAKMLIGYSANIYTENMDGETALDIANNNENMRVVNLLNSLSKKPIKHIFNNKTDLYHLILNGLNANTKDCENKSLLMYASKFGYLDIVKFLIDNGADIEIKDGRGYNALIESVKHGNLDIAAFLIDNEADVNTSISSIFYTALHFAVIKNRLDILELLIQAGANINASDKHGRTPLILAAEFGYADIIQILLDSGANILIKNNDGKNAKQVAKKMYNEACYNILDPLY